MKYRKLEDTTGMRPKHEEDTEAFAAICAMAIFYVCGGLFIWGLIALWRKFR